MQFNTPWTGVSPAYPTWDTMGRTCPLWSPDVRWSAAVVKRVLIPACTARYPSAIPRRILLEGRPRPRCWRAWAWTLRYAQCKG